MMGGDRCDMSSGRTLYGEKGLNAQESLEALSSQTQCNLTFHGDDDCDIFSELRAVGLGI
jgi:hypothetical protein